MFLSTTTALGSIRATRWDCRLRSTGSGRRRKRQPDSMPPQFSCVPLRSTSENCAVLPCFSDFGCFPTAHFLTFPTPISGQVTFQRQGYESDLAFAMDAKCGMYQSSPGERTPFFGAAFCAVIGGCMSLHFRCHNICFCRITRYCCYG